MRNGNAFLWLWVFMRGIHSNIFRATSTQCRHFQCILITLKENNSRLTRKGGGSPTVIQVASWARWNIRNASESCIDSNVIMTKRRESEASLHRTCIWCAHELRALRGAGESSRYLWIQRARNKTAADVHRQAAYNQAGTQRCRLVSTLVAIEW